MMKMKRQTLDNRFEISITHNNSKNSCEMNYKKRDEKKNKENIIQITEPLEPNQLAVNSKDFVNSRDSLNRNKSYLKEVPASSINLSQLSKEFVRQNKKNQQSFQRRLSLKCGTYSQQMQNQKSHRLSMAPLRRDSLGGTTLGPAQSVIDERDSMISLSMRNDSKLIKQQMKKETIITNLINKLEDEEDLRSIIESKLRTKDKKGISQLQYNQPTVMASKLRQCESQIKYFKSIIKQMSQKIAELSEEKQISRNCNQEIQKSLSIFRQKKLKDTQNFLKKQNYCEKCDERVVLNKQLKDIGVQANSQQSTTQSNGSDFLDNLQRTLKVLENKKH